MDEVDEDLRLHEVKDAHAKIVECQQMLKKSTGPFNYAVKKIRNGVVKGRFICYIPSAESCGCPHFFDDLFGGIKEMPYLCSVDGESITLIVTLNYEDYGNNSELQEM